MVARVPMTPMRRADPDGDMVHDRSDHVHDRNVWTDSGLHGFRCRGRGRVARDDDGFAAAGHEVLSDPDDQERNQLWRPVAIRHVGRVPEVEETLRGQCLRQGMGDRQAADARVENPDGGLRGQAWP